MSLQSREQVKPRCRLQTWDELQGFLAPQESSECSSQDNTTELPLKTRL